MAFLAQRGLPDHLTLYILELAGVESVSNVGATSTKSLEFIHRVQCDFPETWLRWYPVNNPPPIGSLVGIRSIHMHHSTLFSDGPPHNLSLTLRSVKLYNTSPSTEVWGALFNLPHLRMLTLASCPIAELRSEMFPAHLRVLRIHSCNQLQSITSLPEQLYELSVCALHSTVWVVVLLAQRFPTFL